VDYAEILATRLGASLADPRRYARGTIKAVFDAYPGLGPVLPAMGYNAVQLADLQATINAVPCDLVLLGTPIDLRRSLTLRHPVARVQYRLEEVEAGSFESILAGL
jgi:predicted GTPase